MPTVTDDDGTGTTGTIINQSWLNTVFTDWTAITFAAGNFTGSGSMTWTVASGDVSANRYAVTNKQLLWYGKYLTTTVGGTPAQSLQVAIPTGTFANTGQLIKCHASDNGTIRDAIAFPASGSLLAIQRADGSNWTASTDNTAVYFNGVWELT